MEDNKCQYKTCREEATTKGFVLARNPDGGEDISVNVLACDKHNKVSGFFKYKISEQVVKVVKDKYVKLKHVEELIGLIKARDAFMDWTSEYEKYNKKVKNTIEWITRNAKEIDE